MTQMCNGIEWHFVDKDPLPEEDAKILVVKDLRNTQSGWHHNIGATPGQERPLVTIVAGWARIEHEEGKTFMSLFGKPPGTDYRTLNGVSSEYIRLWTPWIEVPVPLIGEYALEYEYGQTAWYDKR